MLFLDARSGEQSEPQLQAAAGNLYYISFSPDGRSLAVSGADNAVNVWDVQSRKRLGNPFGPYPGIVALAIFEPNGRLLIVRLENAIEWRMDVHAWEHFACRAAGRDLAPAEWHDVLPNRAYRPICPSSTR